MGSTTSSARETQPSIPPSTNKTPNEYDETENDSIFSFDEAADYFTNPGNANSVDIKHVHHSDKTYQDPVYAVLKVFDNADLMLLVASFLTSSVPSYDRQLVMTSPMLLFVLTFRSLHTRMRAEVRINRRHHKTSYLHSHPKDFTSSFNSISWMLQMGFGKGQDTMRRLRMVCNAAAEADNTEVLQWLKDRLPNECFWNEKTCGFAAMRGNIKTLQWLRSQDPPCPWDEWTCYEAASNNQLETLKWCRSQDEPCPWNGRTTMGAAENGHLEILKWCCNQTPPVHFASYTCASAALNGHLDIMKWCVDRGAHVSTYTCSNAALNGHFEVLKWCRGQTPPCPWDTDTCKNAAIKGHLEILQWCRNQDPPCPWKRNECMAWAKKYPKMLKWMRNQDE